ncbi:response regulator [Flavipsychrobacter stenotrophus]|nr:response regulator [Flavipsychrobacter stenotrophus]
MECVLQNPIPKILLADDDADERYFFEIALKELPTATNLKTVPDGVGLMEYLSRNSDNLPDVLFLDIMMPRKNGIECLTEIMRNEKLKQIPVIMYSNSVGDDYIIKCYQYGATYFLQKGIYSELTESIDKLLAILGRTPNQASKDRFKFSLQGEC